MHSIVNAEKFMQLTLAEVPWGGNDDGRQRGKEQSWQGQTCGSGYVYKNNGSQTETRIVIITQE